MAFFDNKKGLRETYKGMTPEQLVQASQKIDRQNKIDAGPLGLGSGYLGNIIGGGGEMFFGGLGDTARFMNFNGAADTLDKAADYFTERLPEAKPAEFSWNYLTSPEGLARGTGRASGSLASILLPAAVTEGVSLGLTSAGLAARGGALLSRIPGISAKTGKWAAGGLMTVPMESAMEAGNFEKNAIANGMSPSEAAQKSWGVFGRNAGFLALSNALQFGMLPKIAGAGVSFGRRGLAAGAELGTQAVEEGVQQGIQNEMEGKPHTFNPIEMMSNPKYAEQAQAMKEGFLTMAPIVGAGAVGGVVTDRYRNKNSDDEKSAPNIDEFMQALAGQESGGDYNAYNGMYGAAGKFQILPENWAQWAKDAGLSPNAEMTPENQDIVAKNKILEYYKKFGDWRKVAEAWYGGEGAVNWSEEAKSRPQAGGYPSINEYADSVMARLENIVGKVNSEDDESKIEITSEMIENAKGKYWIEQGGVSYEGAQPQTMQALYALSKWFYEKTGKPLVVSAVTNGSHADGEHSHANGWKIDIHDGGSGAEGALFTDDFNEGSLLKEFVKYGQSLGLGMNVESLGTGNVHLDVAVDGTQWIGDDAGTNYGGFKVGKVKRSKSQNISAPNTSETSNENDSVIDSIIQQLLRSDPNATPNFDATKERKIDKEIFKIFVEDKKDNSEGEDAASFMDFLQKNKMLKDDGTFKNSKSNRELLRKEFGEEIQEFGENKIAESYNRFMGNQKSEDEKIRSAFEKLVQQEEIDGKPEATKHREILQNGQIGAMSQFLKDAGINLDAPAESQTQSQEESTADEIKNPADGWKNFNPERLQQLAQFLKSTLTNEGAIDENLSAGLDNLDEQAISDALKMHRQIVSERPVNTILQGNEQTLSDDALKFRESYLKGQENIRRMENARQYYEEQMQNAQANSDVKNFSYAQNRLAEIDKKLETTRSELGKLTPPQNINRVSESEKIASELQENNLKLNGLKAQIADEKSLSRKNKLNRELRETQKKIWAAQERYDEINDVGQTWREKPLSSTDDVLNLLNEGIAQTQRKLNKFKRETRKSGDNPKATKETMRLGSQLSELKTVLNAPVNPTLTISQATERIADAQNNFNGLLNQIAEVEKNLATAQAQGDTQTVTELQRKTLELRSQAANEYDYLTSLKRQTEQAISQHAPKSLNKVYGERKVANVDSQNELPQNIFTNTETNLDEIKFTEENQSENQTSQEIQPEPAKKLSDLELANNELSELKAQGKNLLSEKQAAELRGDYETAADFQKRRAQVDEQIKAKQNEIQRLQGKIKAPTPQEENQSENESKNQTSQKIQPEPAKKLSDLELANNELSELKAKGKNLLSEKQAAELRGDYETAADFQKRRAQVDEQIKAKQNEIQRLQGKIKAPTPQEENQSENESKNQTSQKIQPFDKDKLIQLNRELKNLQGEVMKKNAQRMTAQLNGDLRSEQEIEKDLNNLYKKIRETNAQIKSIQPEKPTKTSESEKPKTNLEGNVAKVKSDNGREYQVRYKVAEGENLTASHNLEGDDVFKNEKYPAELQPRDRERVSMKTNLLSMSNNIKPEELMDSQNLNQGAPIVRSDGVVLNGNGRTAAIQYAQKNGKAGNYRQALLDNAEKFGLKRDAVAKMKNPVLVREIVGEISEEDVKSINESQTGGARIGASEQAKIDAEKIKESSLQLYVDNDTGDLTTAANYDFVLSVLNDIVNQNEINAYTTKEGGISKDGYQRVKQALFALAYGDNRLIDLISESTDNNIRQITNAMNSAAPRIAQIQVRMRQENLFNYDLSAIANAVRKINDLRNSNMTVQNYLHQGTLDFEEAKNETAEKKEIVKFIDAHKTSGVYISDFLKGMADRITSQGNPKQGKIFEFEPATLMEVIKDAEKIADEKFKERSTKGKQINLFGTKPAPKTETPAEKISTPKAEVTPPAEKISAPKVEVTPPAENPAPKGKLRPYKNKEETDRELYEAFGKIPPQADEIKKSSNVEENNEDMEKFIDYFDDSDEHLSELIERKKKRLQEIGSRLNSMGGILFDAELWTIGLEIGGIYIQRGINKFADWAKQMTDSLGEEFKPWQSAIWETLKTLPREGKFNDRQMAAIAQKIGSLYQDGTTDYAEIEEYITSRIDVEGLKPIIRATYNGTKKIFDENINNQQDAENKKAANKGEQDTSKAELAEGYRTESGRNLQDADTREFIIKKDGSKNFGKITDEVAQQSKGRLKVQPIRLQVGFNRLNENGNYDGFGLLHIKKREKALQNLGYKSVEEYLEIISQNYDKIYDISTEKKPNRFLITMHDEHYNSMPVDFIATNDGECYTIVSAFVRGLKREDKQKGEVVFDRSASLSSASNDSRPVQNGSTDENVGINAQSATEKSTSPFENITQTADEGKEESAKDNSAQNKKAAPFELREARELFKEKMRALKDVDIINKATGIVAQVGKAGRSKPLSDVAIGKSIQNGYSAEQHFEAAMNIKQLFEDGWLAETRGDKNQEENVLSIKYFHCETNVKGEKAIARIMAKEIAEYGHKIYTIELQELNKPTELKNRIDSDSSAGSKGSTHNYHIADSRSAEEPSGKNITQTTDEGKTANRQEEKNNIEKIRQERKRQWDEYEKNPLIKKDNVNGLKTETKVADRTGAIKITASTKGGEKITFVLDLKKLNQNNPSEEKIRETISKAIAVEKKQIITYFSPKEALTIQKIMGNSAEIIKKAQIIYDDLKKRVSIDTIGQREIKPRVDIKAEDAIKLAGLEKERFTGKVGISFGSYNEYEISDDGEKYSGDDIIRVETGGETINERDANNITKLMEVMGFRNIGNMRFAFEGEGRRIDDENYPMSTNAYYAFYTFTKNKHLDKNSAEEKQTVSEEKVPLKLPNGKTIYETYTQDKDFLSEGVGKNKIPRWQTIEEKVLDNSRDSLKTAAERKYFDYVKQKLKTADRDIKIPADYKFKEDLRLKNSDGKFEYTARIEGDFKSAEGKQILEEIKKLAEDFGGSLKDNSSKLAGFYFGENQKMMNAFKETVKLYRVPAKDNASQNNSEENVSKYDEVFNKYLESENLTEENILKEPFDNFMKAAVTVDGKKTTIRELLENYAAILAEDHKKVFEIETEYNKIWQSFPEGEFYNNVYISKMALKYMKRVMEKIESEKISEETESQNDTATNQKEEKLSSANDEIEKLAREALKKAGLEGKKATKKIEFEVIKNEVYLDAETSDEIEWDDSPRINKVIWSDLSALIQVLNGETFNQFTLGMITFKSNEDAQIFKTALDIYFDNERATENQQEEKISSADNKVKTEINPFDESTQIAENLQTDAYKKAYGDLKNLWNSYLKGNLDSVELPRQARKIIREFLDSSDTSSQETETLNNKLNNIREHFLDERNNALENFFDLYDRYKKELENKGSEVDKKIDEKVSKMKEGLERYIYYESNDFDAYAELKKFISSQIEGLENERKFYVELQRKAQRGENLTVDEIKEIMDNTENLEVDKELRDALYKKFPELKRFIDRLFQAVEKNIQPFFKNFDKARETLSKFLLMDKKGKNYNEDNVHYYAAQHLDSLWKSEHYAGKSRLNQTEKTKSENVSQIFTQYHNKEITAKELYDKTLKLLHNLKESEKNVTDDSTGAVVKRTGKGNNQNAVGRNDEGGQSERGSISESLQEIGETTRTQRGIRVQTGGTFDSGEIGNSGIQAEESENNADSAGSEQLAGSVRDNFAGSNVDDGRKAESLGIAQNRRINEVTQKLNSKNESKRLQEIRKDLPMLLPEQQEDVDFMEERLFEKGGTGVLLTNGTGTGKTFSGLGVVKRMVDRGNKNILIVTPTEDVNRQWVDVAKNHFGLTLHILENTKDKGAENQICITTYANFQQNIELTGRNWDCVIADESHNLMQNAQGETTGYLDMLRQITLNPRNWYELWRLRNRTKEIIQLEKEIAELKKQIFAGGEVKSQNTRNIEYSLKQIRQKSDKINEIYYQMNDKWGSFKSELEKMQPADRPKVVFLSATPFAYDKCIDYAEGYLFDYEKTEYTGYNQPDGYQKFMIENFGYRMRYNKLTRPDAKVDNRVMEVAFHEKLVREGVMRGRQINIEKDYDRGFILVDGGIGRKIDEGFAWLWAQGEKYSELVRVLNKQFNARNRRYLLESIKARAAVPIIKQYLAQGKKVVVFHQAMKEKENLEPFKFSEKTITTLLTAQGGNKVLAQLELLKKERPDLVNLNLKNLPSPMETFRSAFSDALYIDGSSEHKKGRKDAPKLFNDDNSGKNLIICQQDAANFGLSLHDTTGKMPRVSIIISMPERPSYAMQLEGRTYRVGNASNAVFRYLATGMNLERELFAQTIGGRAETVENLALGNAARGLRESFANSYMETLSDDWHRRKPGHPKEGTGGKEEDSADKLNLNDWQRAISYYYGQLKKTSKNKTAEGKDYFATPEPIGLKMVEWLGLQEGERVLEPSAGHGAISRWFSPNTQNTIIEPSGNLSPLAQLVTPDAKVVTGTFEDFNITNKFEGIVMNPPFGVGGKTAMEHVAKAYKHLTNGGRLIAIVPEGSSMDKRFESWFNGKDAKDAVLTETIHLPNVTFERAGTGVATKILIIDKHTNQKNYQKASQNAGSELNLRNVQDINELFERMENLKVPERLAVTEEKENPLAELEKTFQEITTKDAKNGKPIYYIDGKRVAWIDAANLVKKQNAQRTDFIFDDFSKTENVQFAEVDDYTDAPNIKISVGKSYPSRSVGYREFNSIEDAIKCARYVYQKYSSALVHGQELEVRDKEGNLAFKIKTDDDENKAGTETAYTDEAKKIVAELDAEKSADEKVAAENPASKENQFFADNSNDTEEVPAVEDIKTSYGKPIGNGGTLYKEKFIIPKEDPLTELKKNFKKISDKLAANGIPLCYIDGKRVKEVKAQNLDHDQFKKVADFIFEDAEKNSNVNFVDYTAQTQNDLVMEIHLKGQLSFLVCAYKKAVDKGTLEDIVKCARDIVKKYSYLNNIVDVKVYDGDKYILNVYPFTEILATYTYTDDAKKILEQIYAEKAQNENSKNKDETFEEKFLNGEILPEVPKLSQSANVFEMIAKHDEYETAVEIRQKNCDTMVNAVCQKFVEETGAKVGYDVDGDERYYIIADLWRSPSEYGTGFSTIYFENLEDAKNCARYFYEQTKNLSDVQVNEIAIVDRESESFENDKVFVINLDGTEQEFYYENDSKDSLNEKVATENPAEKIANNHFEIGTHTHTKTGEKIPGAKLKNKVERDEYERLAKLAKSHGGSYSRFAKAFLFKTAAERDAFVNEAYDNYTKSNQKLSQTGDGSTRITNIIDDKNLTDQQKLLQQFGKAMGADVKFFNNYNKNFHGAYEGNTIYLNVNSARSLTSTFAHELFHFLKANNPKLFGEMAKAAGLTEAQLSNYLAETKRNDVKSTADVTEEIIADSMQEILNRVARKDKNLIERFFAWLKDTFSKFKNFFVNPKGKLTRGQYAKMADVFGKMAIKLKDADGKKIFRYNTRTHNLELSNGETLDGLIEDIQNDEGSDEQGFFNLTGAKFSRNNDDTAGTLSDEDEISQKVFEKYLTEGIMKMVRETVEKEIDEHVDFSKMSDPVARDKARDSLPSIRKMLIWYNQAGIRNNPAYQNRLATRIEYARRCFENDERIRTESFRQIDRNDRQGREHKDSTQTLSRNADGQINSSSRRITSGLSRNVGGEISGARKHFLKLYDEIQNENRRSENKNQGVFNLGEKTKYSFAGKKALTANQQSLAQARRMDKAGKSRDEIFKATGWFKGKDNKWRFEIPDNLNQIDFSSIFENEDNEESFWDEEEEYEEDVDEEDEYEEDEYEEDDDEIEVNLYALEEIYNNPKLYAAYPDLKEISVGLLPDDYMEGGLAKVDSEDGNIYFNRSDFFGGDEDTFKAALVHEIQHIIQEKEKFAVGGNPDDVRRQLKRRGIKVDNDVSDLELYQRLGGEQEARAVERRLIFNREGTPTPHNDDALIVFGGKKYSMASVNNSSENQNNAMGRFFLPEGYRTESGRAVRISNSEEFIVDETGNKDLWQIPASVEQNSNGKIKALPVRLQVGRHFGASNTGSGFVHISRKHLRAILEHGFNNAFDFVDYVIKNFNKGYEHPRINNRVILFCNDSSRGFMPIEMIREGNYYRIVTAYPKERNVNGELIYNESETSSAATTDDTTGQSTNSNVTVGGTNNNGGVNSLAANVEINSPSENIPQSSSNGNVKFSIGSSDDSQSSNDNSSEGLFSKIKNLLTGRPNQQNERIRKKINSMLSKLAGVKIAAGHMNNGLDIVVKDVEKVIRTNRAYDWQNLLPAVGQKIAAILKLNPSAEMGNYIADWLLTGALNNTSAESKNFEKALRDNPEIRENLLEIQDTFAKWRNMTPSERIQATIEFERPKPTLGEKVKSAKNEGYQQFFEELEPVNDLVKQWEKITGEKLSDAVNPYSLLRNYRGIAGRAKLLIEGNESAINALKQMFPQMKWDGFKTIKMILSEIGALENESIRREFSAFCEAKHVKDMFIKNREIQASIKKVQDRIAELEKMKSQTTDAKRIKDLDKRIKQNQKKLENLKLYDTPMTESDCDAMIKDFSGKYGTAQKDLVKFSNATLTILKNSGVITEQAYFNMLRDWKNYVPMHRVFDENEDIKFGDSLKKMQGSSRDVVDPLQAIIRNTYDYIRRAEKNEAKLMLASMARTGGVGMLVEEVDGKIPDDKTTIMFYENGVKKYLQTDVAVVRAVNNMTPPSMSWFTKFLRIGTMLLRNFATVYNPSFAARNLIRDWQDAFIYSKYGFFSPMDFVRGFIHAVKQDDVYAEWMAAGGAQASFWSVDRDYTEASINNLTKRGLKKYTSVNGFLDLFSRLGEWSELGTRIGYFEKAKKSIAEKNGGKIDRAALVTAALESRDLMDFARGGKASRSWNNAVAFANANLQGWDKFFRTFDPRNNKWKTKEWQRAMINLALTSVVPAVLFFLLNHDKDWYRNDLPDYEKQNYWILGENLRVPKGLDLGIRFFSNLTENVLNSAYNKDPKAFNSWWKPLSDSAPGLIPTGLEPIIECLTNYDMFRQRAIVPQYQQKLPAASQYDANTTSLAKFIGETANISPRKVDHFLFGYTGNVGRETLRIGESALGLRDYNFRGINDLPLLGGFFRIPYQNPKVVKDFYEKLDEQTAWHNEYKATKKKPAEYNETLYNRLHKAQKEMSEISKLERKLMLDPNISGEVKQERQLALQKKRVALAERAVK